MIFGSSTRSNDVKDESKDTELVSQPADATPSQNLPSTSPSELKKPNNNQPASTEQPKTQPGTNSNPQQ